MIEKITPDFEFSNSAGKLVQLVHEGWKQVNVLQSNKGEKRGGHYHKESKEAFYIVKGCLKALFENGGYEETIEYVEGDMFVIPTNIKHTFIFHEDTIMVGLYDKPVEKKDGSKDIYR